MIIQKVRAHRHYLRVDDPVGGIGDGERVGDETLLFGASLMTSSVGDLFYRFSSLIQLQPIDSLT